MHYAARMADAGWERLRLIESTNATVQTFTHVESDGTRFFAVLTLASPPQSTIVDLSIIVSRM